MACALRCVVATTMGRLLRQGIRESVLERELQAAQYEAGTRLHANHNVRHVPHCTEVAVPAEVHGPQADGAPRVI
jgi:hypothetical protein